MKKPFKKLFLLSVPVAAVVVAGSAAAKILRKPKNEKLIDSLLPQMTLEEKIGQMLQVDANALDNPEDIKTFAIGSILSGGDSEIDDISAEGWAKFYDSLQSYALQSRLKIPLIYGIDAVHGHNNVKGAVIFPHNIGLGCTNDTNLVQKASRITAEEVAGTGINWTFAPCVAVPRNERWGRTYEGFGENPDLVGKMGAAAVKGLQGRDLSAPGSILACAKHFVGDGGTLNGVDQGNTECDESTLRRIHLAPYVDAIRAGVGSIMVSFSGWNGRKMHSHKYLLTDVLKKKLGFKGFLVSDWAAIDQLSTDFKKCIEISVNAGLDMIMIPHGSNKKNNYREFLTYLKDLVDEGKIPLSRIDDAVKRILKIKSDMNLFERPYADKTFTSGVGSDEHRQVARECVRKSLVLLKNENNVLPASKDLKKILVIGRASDDIGMQCGGWTISWQGRMGNITSGGTTILQAIKKTVSENTQVVYSSNTNQPNTNGSGNLDNADLAIVVIGETPYAEMKGDKRDLNLSDDDIRLIEQVKKKGIPTIVILISGRPMIIEKALPLCDAFIAAWLPGTEGQGVADLLFGDYNFTGKLSHSWPKSMAQIPVNIGDRNYDPLFKFGFGLNYDTK